MSESSWIGHPDAQRRNTPDGWEYRDGGNTTLRFVAMIYKLNLLDVDGFIERMEGEGEGVGTELRLRRKKVTEHMLRGRPGSVQALDDDLVLRHLEWIKFRMNAVMKAEAIGPAIELHVRDKTSESLAAALAARPPAPQAEPRAEQTEQARRLKRLREMGGVSKYKNGKWQFTKIVALASLEATEGRLGKSEKTIRAHLVEAAEAEREATRAGLFNRLGAG